jgi:hypothetical protein
MRSRDGRPVTRIDGRCPIGLRANCGPASTPKDPARVMSNPSLTRTGKRCAGERAGCDFQLAIAIAGPQPGMLFSSLHRRRRVHVPNGRSRTAVDLPIRSGGCLAAVRFRSRESRQPFRRCKCCESCRRFEAALDGYGATQGKRNTARRKSPAQAVPDELVPAQLAAAVVSAIVKMQAHAD